MWSNKCEKSQISLLVKFSWRGPLLSLESPIKCYAFFKHIGEERTADEESVPVGGVLFFHNWNERLIWKKHLCCSLTQQMSSNVMTLQWCINHHSAGTRGSAGNALLTWTGVSLSSLSATGGIRSGIISSIEWSLNWLLARVSRFCWQIFDNIFQMWETFEEKWGGFLVAKKTWEFSSTILKKSMSGTELVKPLDLIKLSKIHLFDPFNATVFPIWCWFLSIMLQGNTWCWAQMQSSLLNVPSKIQEIFIATKRELFGIQLPLFTGCGQNFELQVVCPCCSLKLCQELEPHSCMLQQVFFHLNTSNPWGQGNQVVHKAAKKQSNPPMKQHCQCGCLKFSLQS